MTSHVNISYVRFQQFIVIHMERKDRYRSTAVLFYIIQKDFLEELHIC